MHAFPDLAEASVDRSSQFRAAMRSMAATVTIVSTKSGDQRHGMTATAVTSVSMAPPSILVAVNRSASVHPALARDGPLCINILSECHKGLCADFSGAKKGEDRFQENDWGERFGVPYLINAQSNVFCTIEETLDYGTHTLFLCRVDDVRLGRSSRPLVYLAGGFIPAIKVAPCR